MKIAYVDTSCLAAIAFEEPDHQKLASEMRRFGVLLSSNLAEAELRAALRREEIATEPTEILSWLEWVLPDRPLTAEMRQVLAAGQVRGADLWHLACAEFSRRRTRWSEMAFLTRDQRQAEVARALGFRVSPVA